MNDTTRAAFLALVAPRNGKTLQETLDRVEDALAVIEEGTRKGSILNVDFKDAKLTLDRTVEAAYDAAINPFWHGKGGTLSEDRETNEFLNDLVYKSVDYVRDAIARSKFLAKTTIQHPMVVEARRVVAAILPLALEMEALKGHIVSGRRPPTAEVVAERARKAAMVKSMARATCGCCFGNQAVHPDNRIHDHGYRKPRAWMKSGSCYGWGKLSLEVSDEGPRFMVDLLTRKAADQAKFIKNLRAATKLSIQDGYEVKDGHRVEKFVDITPAHRDFERTKQYRVGEEERTLRAIHQDLGVFKKVVAEWKPGAQPERSIF